VIQVVQANVGLEAATVVTVALRDHRLAVVDAGGGIADRVDAADDVFLVTRTQVLNGKPRHLTGDAHDAGGHVALQGLAGDRLHRCRQIQHPFGLELGGRNRHLFQGIWAGLGRDGQPAQHDQRQETHRDDPRSERRWFWHD